MKIIFDSTYQIDHIEPIKFHIYQLERAVMRFIIGITILSVLLPKFALMCLSGLYRHKKISIYTRTYSGQNFERIEHRTITVANRALSDIDTWLLYIQGKLDLIGPRPLDFNVALKIDKETDQRHYIRPGIISPAQIKNCLLYTSPSPRDGLLSRMPSSA